MSIIRKRVGAEKIPGRAQVRAQHLGNDDGKEEHEEAGQRKRGKRADRDMDPCSGRALVDFGVVIYICLVCLTFSSIARQAFSGGQLLLA